MFRYIFIFSKPCFFVVIKVASKTLFFFKKYSFASITLEKVLSITEGSHVPRHSGVGASNVSGVQRIFFLNLPEKRSCDKFS